MAFSQNLLWLADEDEESSLEDTAASDDALRISVDALAPELIGSAGLTLKPSSFLTIAGVI